MDPASSSLSAEAVTSTNSWNHPLKAVEMRPTSAKVRQIATDLSYHLPELFPLASIFAAGRVIIKPKF
ncbi:MAG: hypothetical protein AAF531_02860 [Actinomycetota bacterium]